jgi:hypothetical protein
MLNAYWGLLSFELPPVPAGTGGDAGSIQRSSPPGDICPWHSATVATQATYVVQPQSVVLLVCGSSPKWNDSIEETIQ